MNRRKIVILILTLLLLSGGGWFLYATGFFRAVTSLPQLRAYINRFAPCSHLLFFLLLGRS